ncbi:hypothetical protein [Legionella jamestowniensis]|uniref:hypothetical protein n=1 Tax=Legionella jamestowniensis TaxID=455 RepID=UPI0008EB6682|nr:hypothetical protein [Legionella jamestowniensis]SFM07728.1 hypothetical protein SAMN02746073_0277 [Legionella jamestowniensis DSM 19215]
MVKIKGSKDGDILTADFKGQSKSLFPDLKKTKALVLLSIRGNPYCTDKYLKAIIEKALSTFAFTTFLIADEVYWHNLCDDFENANISALKEEAKALGQAFFEDHLKYFLAAPGFNAPEFDSHLIEYFPLDKKEALNKTANNFEVLNWVDWLHQSKQYIELQDNIKALFSTEELLSNSVQRVAADFAKRHTNVNESHDLLMLRSSKYLIEESPAVMWIAASLGYQFIVYPGEQIQSFAATKNYFVKNAPQINPMFIHHKKPQLLANWLEVSFVRSRSSDKGSKPMPSKEVPGCLSQLMKGVTEGIFALNLNKQEKIQLVADIMRHYQEQSVTALLTNETS